MRIPPLTRILIRVSEEMPLIPCTYEDQLMRIFPSRKSCVNRGPPLVMWESKDGGNESTWYLSTSLLDNKSRKKVFVCFQAIKNRNMSVRYFFNLLEHTKVSLILMTFFFLWWAV